MKGHYSDAYRITASSVVMATTIIIDTGTGTIVAITIVALETCA